MQTAFAYLRVSGRSQLGGDGFPRQNHAIKQYAKSYGIQVVRTLEERGVYREALLRDSEYKHLEVTDVFPTQRLECE